MFDSQPETTKAMNRAWKALERMERGEMFSHEDMAKAFGFDSRDKRYYQMAARLNRKLEKERGISLVSVPLVGYMLATAMGQLDYAKNRVIRAARQKRRARSTVMALPVEECQTQAEQKAKFHMEEKLAASEREDRKEYRLINFLMRPRDQMPRIQRDDEADTA
jgi:hypothetical protein